jgi:hypothetical protein
MRRPPGFKLGVLLRKIRNGCLSSSRMVRLLDQARMKRRTPSQIIMAVGPTKMPHRVLARGVTGKRRDVDFFRRVDGGREVTAPRTRARRGPLRYEKRTGQRTEEHHRDRNALLPVHAQAAFLLMAPIRTGPAETVRIAKISDCSIGSFLENNFNTIKVRIFILHGAPFLYKREKRRCGIAMFGSCK